MLTGGFREEDGVLVQDPEVKQAAADMLNGGADSAFSEGLELQLDDADLNDTQKVPLSFD